MKKLIKLNIILKLLLIIFGAWGLWLSFLGNDLAGKGMAILYYTVQSNILTMLICAIFLVSNIKEALGKKSFINKVLLDIKFAITVGITITFIVFFIILAPTMEMSYLKSPANLTVHLFVPVLAIVDLLTFDRTHKVSKVKSLIGISMPLYYCVLVLTQSFLGVIFGQNQKVPYFFLDYDRLGWFALNNGIGVAYWIMMLSLLTILVSLTIRYAMKKINEKRPLA